MLYYLLNRRYYVLSQRPEVFLTRFFSLSSNLTGHLQIRMERRMQFWTIFYQNWRFINQNPNMAILIKTIIMPIEFDVSNTKIGILKLYSDSSETDGNVPSSIGIGSAYCLNLPLFSIYYFTHGSCLDLPLFIDKQVALHQHYPVIYVHTNVGRV